MATSPLPQLVRLVDSGWILLVWFVFVALVVCAVTVGGRSSRQANRGTRVLRVILSTCAGLLVLLCLLEVIFAVRLVYGHDAPGSSIQLGARGQAVMGLVVSAFSRHCLVLAIVAICVITPCTRSLPHMSWAATLFVVAVSVPLTIVLYCPVIWWPGADFRFYARTLAPPLACLIAAGVWSGAKVAMALRQQRDVRTWTIGGLAAFHLICVGTYTLLVCVLSMRMAAAELSQ